MATVLAYRGGTGHRFHRVAGAFTRTGANLGFESSSDAGAFDKSTIPYYNVYFSDTWHMKPTFTLTYGLGWTLEMPPVEAERQAG